MTKAYDISDKIFFYINFGTKSYTEITHIIPKNAIFLEILSTVYRCRGVLTWSNIQLKFIKFEKSEVIMMGRHLSFKCLRCPMLRIFFVAKKTQLRVFPLCTVHHCLRFCQIRKSNIANIENTFLLDSEEGRRGGGGVWEVG